MIRVNLLPIKEARRRSAGRMQLAVFIVLLILELGGFAGLYVWQKRRVDAMEKKMRQTREKKNEKQAKVDETREYEQKFKKLQEKKKTLNKLEAKSVGPGPMLRELGEILSTPSNEEEKFAQRERGWNVKWDPSNLWYKTFDETDGSFTLEGRAVDADDVAEFLHRLETASHFNNVKLDYVRPSKNSDANLVGFRITGELTYVVE